MKSSERTLEQADRFHLNAASGWIGLGDLDSARAELSQISPWQRLHPEVLLVHGELFFADEDWKSLVELSADLIENFPKLEPLWIQRSYALHELRRTQEAFDQLLPATRKFRNSWLIRYNLACYCSRLGNSTEALRLLRKAMELANVAQIKEMALDDPDFAALREKIRQM